MPPMRPAGTEEALIPHLAPGNAPGPGGRVRACPSGRGGVWLLPPACGPGVFRSRPSRRLRAECRHTDAPESHPSHSGHTSTHRQRAARGDRGLRRRRLLSPRHVSPIKGCFGAGRAVPKAKLSDQERSGSESSRFVKSAEGLRGLSASGSCRECHGKRPARGGCQPGTRNTLAATGLRRELKIVGKSEAKTPPASPVRKGVPSRRLVSGRRECAPRDPLASAESVAWTGRLRTVLARDEAGTLIRRRNPDAVSPASDSSLKASGAVSYQAVPALTWSFLAATATITPIARGPRLGETATWPVRSGRAQSAPPRRR
jgi:hypothetical protein